MAERELDQRLPALSSEYASLAALMPPLVRALIVNNAEPWTVGAQAVLDELKLGGWYADEEDAAALEYIPGLLSASQCAAVRAALEAAEEAEEGGEWCKRDSVDEALDYQLNITKDGLLALVGPEAVALLWAHAGRCHTAMNPGAHLPGLSLGATALPEVHEIFIRRYSSATRPWFGFHVDRSQLTVNIALSDDAAHRGGSLLAIYDGLVQVVPRGEGGATVHPSGLQHAVSRMYGGTRYSLILFFGRICPWAPEHALVRCDADCLRRLYADYGGNYNCNGCNRSCVDLGWPSMLHCAAGCEFDVCDACATRYADAAAQYVGWDCAHLPGLPPDFQLSSARVIAI